MPTSPAPNEQAALPQPVPYSAPIDLSELYCKADGERGEESKLQPPLACAGTVGGRRHFSVAEARQLAHAPELSGARLLLEIEGYVDRTNFDAAPLCAWHLPHEPEPAGCQAERPRLWLCDSVAAPAEECLEVDQFASSFAELRAAQLWNAPLTPLALRDHNLRYFDSGLHQLVPAPLPVRSSRVRFIGSVATSERGTQGPVPAHGSFELLMPTPVVESLPAATPTPKTRAELWSDEAWIRERLRRIPDCQGASVEISPPLNGNFIWTSSPARYYEITCEETLLRPTFYAVMDETTRSLAALACRNDTRTPEWSWRCNAERVVLPGRNNHPDVLVVLHSGCSPSGCIDLFELPSLSTEAALNISDELLRELDRIKNSRFELHQTELRIFSSLSCIEEDPNHPARPGCVMNHRYRIRYRGASLVFERTK
jgi:hypothetical protein